MNLTFGAVATGLIAVWTFHALPTGQVSKPAPPNVWLTRSELITDDLLADGASLSEFDRALLFGRLAEMWWTLKPEAARAWLKKSVELLKPPSDLIAEDESTRRKRFIAIGALNTIAVRLDKSLSDQLVSQISAEQGPLSAEALVEAAKVVLENDPKRAAELASASLRVGRTNHFYTILWRLRTVDSKWADALFREALSLARATSDAQLFDALVGAAFINKEFPGAAAAAAPEELQLEVLASLASALGRQGTTPHQQIEICRLAPIAAPLLDEFWRLSPAEVNSVRDAVQRCQALQSGGVRRQISDQISERPLKDVDDFLKAANETRDRQAAVSYLFRAAYLASQEKEFDRAISILDGMSSQDLASSGNQKAWDSARMAFATSGALAYLKHHDFYSMRRLIADTPGRLRPFVQVQVAEKMAADGYRADAIELMRDAREGLPKTEPSDSVYHYLNLTYLCAKLIPSDALTTLIDAVKAINTAHRLRDTQQQKESVTEVWRVIPMPDSLMELNDQGVRTTLSSVDSPTMRVALRCGLLSSALARVKAGNKSQGGAPSVNRSTRDPRP